MDELDDNNSSYKESVVDNKLDKKKANIDCFGESYNCEIEENLKIITSKNNLIFEIKN